LQNPSNTYVFSGSYTSSLTITDEFGCTDEVIFNDFLNIGGPTGEFEWDLVGLACDQNFEFYVIDTNDVSQIEWFPGDGSWFSSLNGGTHIFSESGEFYPYVIISDENDCAVTYYLDTIDVIFGEINAGFSVNPTTLNWGDIVDVTNESTGGIGGIISNSWSFGNDSFDNNNQNFDYLFDEAGDLTIVLIVEDSLGCTDTAVVNVSVTALLAYPNVFSPNGDGSNEVFRFIYNAFREFEVVILNRWGNVVSSGSYVDINYLWDGRLPNGDLASEGVYFYQVKGILRDNTYREDYGFFHLVMD
jgi:gliding motility-associated-like protein